MKHHRFIGIDRSDSTLDFCILDASGEFLRHSKISSSPESLLPWVLELQSDLPPDSDISLCIEQPCQNLVHFFSQFDFLRLYLVNPAVIKKYRESLSASRAKDDRRDARALAHFVHERHARLDPWAPVDPLASQIAMFSEKRRQLVGVRTCLTNKLTQALKDSFPQALDLVGRDIFTPLACAFLTKWPNLAALCKARPSTISQFYYQHRSRRAEIIEKRLSIIANSVPLCTNKPILEVYTELILGLVRQISTIQISIRRFDKLIEESTDKHQDARIFKTLPGAGAALSARLLGFFGSDRSKYSAADDIQKHSGVAPLTKQSGKMHFVHRRYACNKFWRQTFVEWAAQTVIKSLWAKAYYQQQKDKGQRHQTILRGLAYKWQRILFRCWKNHEVYNEKRYLEVLRKRSSPLLPIIAEIRKTKPKFCEQFQ
ncbi:IS110 family transposase [Haloferula sp.]|uniref:IS110 family transposase n=1 Tax=Haloferula sp. TaxID=2497595 RepID=UPI003C77C8B3